MKKPLLLTLWICLPALLAGAGRDVSHSEWQGKLVIQQYSFIYGTGQKYLYGPGGSFLGTKPVVARRVERTARYYDVYQGVGGAVLERLTRATGQRSLGPPIDIRLLHYDAGWGFVFDKGGSNAVKGPLTPPTAPGEIGKRTILGFSCEGKQYTWKTWQGGTVELETWKPSSSGLMVPLLQVIHFADKTGALLALTVQFVSQIEPASNLPESLFRLPKGLQVTNVPFIQ